MDTAFELSICDGKYTYKYDGCGKQEVLRYGQPWCRDLSGDKFVFSLAVELDEANKELTHYRAVMEQAVGAFQVSVDWDISATGKQLACMNALIALREVLKEE